MYNIFENLPERLAVSALQSSNHPSIETQTIISGNQFRAAAFTLIDSGATGNLINQAYVLKHKIPMITLPRPIPLTNVDGSENKVQFYIRCVISITDKQGHTHREKQKLYVANLGKQDVILGTDWLNEHNPEIDWRQYTVSMTRCPRTCHYNGIVSIQTLTPNQIPSMATESRRLAVRQIHLDSSDQQEEEVFPLEGLLLVRSLNQKDEQVDLEHAMNAKANPSQKLAQQGQEKPKLPITEQVPKHYHDYLIIFEKKASERFPSSKPWDHAIDLKPDAVIKGCKVYPLSPVEDDYLKEWLDENLKKGYIRPSKSPMASPFFFVPKKDKSLRPTQDYRYVNSQTIKNAYPIPLISELIDKLKGASIFSKLDLRWGYNNVRIKDGDQWKAAFKTNRGLFEPMVMFFGLTNSPATFQTMMNELFKELIDLGVVIVYLDDILIFTDDNLEYHRKIVRQVLQILKDNDLFAKPEKCMFEAPNIEYLGVIVSKGVITMDPVKVEGVQQWPIPRKVKEVQSFLGFCNFYRRFIKDFSKIARPLFDLTHKEHLWDWTTKCQEAFDELKAVFISAPLLVMPDTLQPFRIECDASDYATGAVLSQQQQDELWHPAAYLSKSLNDAERNYDIYDKELLAVIRALEAWRHYLEGCRHTIEVWTDHRNLEYFRTAQKLSRRQARWAQFLTRFDIKLIHKPGVTNKSDGLSRRPDHKEGVDQDNTDQILLPKELFMEQTEEPIMARTVREATLEHTAGLAEVVTVEPDPELKEQLRAKVGLDPEVQIALDTIKKQGPGAMTKGLDDWTLEDGLILYRGLIYVPNDLELRREVVRSCHDPEIHGHPGRYKTLEIVQRNFWWPGMSKLVQQYVDGCATCQETKNITHPTVQPLHPTERPNLPFEFITMDFITKLPESNGCDSILVVTDQATKTAVTEACRETIDAEGTADILLKSVFRRYGVSKKIISDRGPQFASKVMQAILKGLGTRSALSTAYHPQTDGATERLNQELEQYFRAYCNRNQNNWARLLPFAEIAHNSREHSATKQIPFVLLHGYPPNWPAVITAASQVPRAAERLKEIQHAREEANAAQLIAIEAMKQSHRSFGAQGSNFQKGDRVWLEGKNLKTQYPSAKLAPKRHGPLDVLEVLGNGTYRLELPRTWRIHPVFHASLLTPYVETTAHGPNYERPPPDLVEGEEEFEIEEIIKFSPRRYNSPQYFVKWKGYPESENSWVKVQDMGNAQELMEAFHKEHPELEKPTVAIMLLKFDMGAVRQRVLGRRVTELHRQLFPDDFKGIKGGAL